MASGEAKNASRRWGWVLPSAVKWGRAMLSYEIATCMPLFFAIFCLPSLQLELSGEVFRSYPRKPQLLSFSERFDAVAPAVDLPDSEAELRTHLQSDRHHHARQSGDRLGPAARHRRLHRQAPSAVFAVGRHGVHVVRHGAARVRPDVLRHHRRVGAHRSRLGSFSPGVLARGAPRVGWTPRLCAGVFSGGRKPWVRYRSPTGGVFRAPARPALDRVVFVDGVAGHGVPLECRQLVQADERL